MAVRGPGRLRDATISQARSSISGRVLEATGILPEETLGIGDHLNDIEMIQSAGIGVAMANALPEALAVADWVTTSVYENGVAVAIKRFILSKNGS